VAFAIPHACCTSAPQQSWKNEKKEPELDQVHQAVVQPLPPEHVEVELWRADALEVRHGLSAERDEMWSYVQSTAHPRWWGHAMDHHTGKVLASVFGRRQDTVFRERQALLEPFGITRSCTDGWGAYERPLDAAQHQVGKAYTQKIESKHLPLRTRIKPRFRTTHVSLSNFWVPIPCRYKGGA
jgi:insertion element IS1 protein InsB